MTMTLTSGIETRVNSKLFLVCETENSVYYFQRGIVTKVVSKATQRELHGHQMLGLAILGRSRNGMNLRPRDGSPEIGDRLHFMTDARTVFTTSRIVRIR